MGPYTVDGWMEQLDCRSMYNIGNTVMCTSLHRFEKMVSGMYMGEIVRLVLCHLSAQGILFNGEGSEELLLPNRFLTKYISEIERCVQLTPHN